MQSLRTRRSQAPPRKAQRQPSKLAKPGSSGVVLRNKSQSSRVDDKIKKRMSMRYADISSPTELNLPPMPTLPAGIAGNRTRRGEEEVVKTQLQQIGEVKAVVDDNALLDDEGFDPDAFLKTKLANSTEAELKSLQSSLRGAKEDTAADLQRNVFKNYAEFVLISKEISTLENEMLELKESLSEYKSMPSLLHIPDPSSSNSSALSSYRRSSVADLRIMYFNQMQTLHSQIEGSAKFAPTTPGRHVVGEIDGILALNAATYKAVGKVKFVVLDDAVLVAKRRRRTAGGGGEAVRGGGSVGEGKLVAEKCWPLNEMLVLDTKDSPSMTNVFKIKHGKETHVYRTETSADKKSLLQQLRHVAEELSAKKRKEREGEHERRRTLWGGGGDRSSALTGPEWMADLARRAGEVPGANAKEKADRDAQWVGEWADDLTVAIALKEWEKATSLVEEGRAKLSTVPPLSAKLPALTSQLTSSLLDTLSIMSNRKTTVVFLIGLLSRLNSGAAARAAFLAMRSKVLKSHVRKIRFEGHVGAYVGDLAVVYFTGIKHTSDWFLTSFKENEVTSVLIEWAKDQIEEYAEMFRRQVYSEDVESKVVEEAMKITYSQSKKYLEDFGLDFRFLLDALLVKDPKISKRASTPFSFKENQVVNPVKLISPIVPQSARRSPALTIPTPTVSISVSSSPTKSPSMSTGTSIPNPPPSATGTSYSSASSYASTPLPSSRPSALRSRTPTSAAAPTPLSAPTPIVPPASPLPRRTRSPPPSASPLRPRDRSRTPGSTRGAVGGGTSSPVPLPPRSTNRPGSVSHRPPPVAVPQREGMI